MTWNEVEKRGGRVMAKHKLFREKAPGVMTRLMADFDFSEDQAAGILGNIGHECAGFESLHEIGQPAGKGGYGWCQWTGPRRKLFFGWCDKHGLDWQSDAANYGYLKYDLENEYKYTVSSVLKAKTIHDAVKAFERKYEVAGVPHYASRNAWADEALEAYKAS
jgi:hypothetical protein